MKWLIVSQKCFPRIQSYLIIQFPFHVVTTLICNFKHFHNHYRQLVIILLIPINKTISGVVYRCLKSGFYLKNLTLCVCILIMKYVITYTKMKVITFSLCNNKITFIFHLFNDTFMSPLCKITNKTYY